MGALEKVKVWENWKWRMLRSTREEEVKGRGVLKKENTLRASERVKAGEH